MSSPPAHADLEPLVENWWMMATRGVLAVLFGCVMAVWRVPVLDAVTLPFAAYAVADGVLAFALAWPFLPRTVFVVLVAWGLLTGVLEIAAVLRVRPSSPPGGGCSTSAARCWPCTPRDSRSQSPRRRTRGSWRPRADSSPR